MQLILAYPAVGIDGRNANGCFRIEAESKEAVKAVLREAAECAAANQEPQFEAFGEQHYTHNLVKSVPLKRLEYLQRLAALKGLKGPAFFSIRGTHYGFSPFKLMTVDEWFASAGHSAAPVAA